MNPIVLAFLYAITYLSFGCLEAEETSNNRGSLKAPDGNEAKVDDLTEDSGSDDIEELPEEEDDAAPEAHENDADLEKEMAEPLESNPDQKEESDSMDLEDLDPLDDMDLLPSFKFKTILIDDETKAAMLLGPDSRIMMGPAGQSPILVSATGFSSSYGEVDEKFSTPVQHKDAGDFSLFYSLAGAGFFGVEEGRLSYALSQPKIAKRIKLPVDITKQSVKGIAPGFLAIQANQEVFFTNRGDKGLKMFKIGQSPEDLVAVYPCEKGCSLVAFADGALYSLLKSGSKWQKADLYLEFPSDKAIVAMAGSFGMVDDQLNVEDLVFLTEELSIWQLDQESKENKSEASWEVTLALGQKYCQPCHADDGYHLKRTWTGQKDSILRRISPENKEKTASMPPATTAWGKDISDQERQLMMTWLSAEEATEGGRVPGGGADEDQEEPEISGRLKALAQPNCIGCHPDGKEVKWWKARKDDLLDRIGSDNMPRGRTMDRGDKAEILKIISEL